MAEEDFTLGGDETPKATPSPSAGITIKVPKQKTPAPPPVDDTPASKKEKPMTVGGFAENALDDAWDFAKGLYNIFPAAIKSYQQNVPYIAKNIDALKPSMLFNWNDKEGEFQGAIPETAKGIIDAVKQPYQEHGARVLYEKPFTVAADAITLITVGAGQIKNIGQIAKAAGAGEKAERLIRAGEYLEQLPSKLARGAVDKGVEFATGHDLAKERQFLNIKQEERGAEMLKLQDVAQQNLPTIDALNPEEKALFHKARTGGGTAYGVSEEVLAQNPKVKAALEAYAPLEQYSKEVALKHGFLSQEEMDQALAKKYSLEHFGDVSKENIAKAAELIDEAKATGKRLPMYGPNVFEGKGPKGFSGDDLLHDLMTGGKTVREGKVGAFEELKGAKGYSTDPSVYTRQMVKSAADVEAKARMMDRVLQERELITAKGGKAQEGFKAGESIPEGIHRKYYEDPIRAQALQSITDPTIKRLLKWEYTGKQNAMLQLYDKFFSLFAKMATRWNPKWVPGNIVGDAFLGALFGADWDAARAFIKERNLPSQFLSGKVSYNPADALEKKGIITGALDKYGDIAGQIDQATRAGILTRHVAEKLKRFAADHEAFAQSIKDVLGSTQRFSDVQVGLQRIEEDTARRSLTVRKRDAELVALQQREQKLTAAIAEATQKDVNKLASKTGQKIESTFQRAQEQAASQMMERQAKMASERSAALNKATASRVESAEAGRSAGTSKANLDRLEKLYNSLTKDAPLVETEARKRLASIPQEQIAKEMNDLLSRYPGYSRTRDPKIVREIRGQVRDAVLRRHLEELKAEVYPQIREGLERHILNVTGEYEKLVKRGKAAAAYQMPESFKATPIEGVKVIEGAPTPSRPISPAIQNALSKRDALRQQIVNKTTERNAILRDIMDDRIKSGELEKLVPGLREQVAIVREGVDRANAVLPSYLNLNGFEQRVMGRIIPFYPFVKTMNMLAFRIPFLAPVKSFMWNRLQEFLTTQTEDPRVQEYTKGRIPIHVLEDGRTVWWKLTTYSPFEQLKTARPGGIPLPGMFDPLRQPAIALGYKFLGGKTVFDLGLPYGEQAVSIGDGSVDRLLDNGKIRREIEPTPVVSGVMHTFPATQLLEAVLAPSRLNKYDWLGFPHPVMNPDGTYKAPNELFSRIGAALGFNLQARSKEEIMRSDKIESYKAFKALRKAYKTADPDEREMIQEAFKDRANGMYRQREH